MQDAHPTRHQNGVRILELQLFKNVYPEEDGVPVLPRASRSSNVIGGKLAGNGNSYGNNYNAHSRYDDDDAQDRNVAWVSQAKKLSRLMD